jgi:hypothetical protein
MADTERLASDTDAERSLGSDRWLLFRAVRTVITTMATVTQYDI